MTISQEPWRLLTEVASELNTYRLKLYWMKQNQTEGDEGLRTEPREAVKLV